MDPTKARAAMGASSQAAAWRARYLSKLHVAGPVPPAPISLVHKDENTSPPPPFPLRGTKRRNSESSSETGSLASRGSSEHLRKALGQLSVASGGAGGAGEAAAAQSRPHLSSPSSSISPISAAATAASAAMMIPTHAAAVHHSSFYGGAATGIFEEAGTTEGDEERAGGIALSLPNRAGFLSGLLVSTSGLLGTSAPTTPTPLASARSRGGGAGIFEGEFDDDGGFGGAHRRRAENFGGSIGGGGWFPRSSASSSLAGGSGGSGEKKQRHGHSGEAAGRGRRRRRTSTATSASSSSYAAGYGDGDGDGEEDSERESVAPGEGSGSGHGGRAGSSVSGSASSSSSSSAAASVISGGGASGVVSSSTSATKGAGGGGGKKKRERIGSVDSVDSNASGLLIGGRRAPRRSIGLDGGSDDLSSVDDGGASEGAETSSTAAATATGGGGGGGGGVSTHTASRVYHQRYGKTGSGVAAAVAAARTRRVSGLVPKEARAHAGAVGSPTLGGSSGGGGLGVGFHFQQGSPQGFLLLPHPAEGIPSARLEEDEDEDEGDYDDEEQDQDEEEEEGEDDDVVGSLPRTGAGGGGGFLQPSGRGYGSSSAVAAPPSHAAPLPPHPQLAAVPASHMPLAPSFVPPHLLSAKSAAAGDPFSMGIGAQIRPNRLNNLV